MALFSYWFRFMNFNSNLDSNLNILNHKSNLIRAGSVEL